jgi:hypothetical protein
MGRTNNAALTPTAEQDWPRSFFLDEDWRTFGAQWSSVLTGSATVAAGVDASQTQLGPILTLSTIDSVTNRECYAKTTIESFDLLQDRPLTLECSLQFSEASASGPNGAAIFGLMNSVAAGALVDNTGEPKASFSGAIIYKPVGTSVWKTCSSVGTTQNKNTSGVAASLQGNSTSFVRLRVEISPVSSTVAEVSYFADGDPLTLPGLRPGLNRIKDQLTFAGSVPMSLFFGLKNGDNTPQTLRIRWVRVRGLRA